MYCNKCWSTDTSVVETRTWDDWKSIRRRRSCNTCSNRFTTYEKIEIVNMIVEKNWDRKERYNRNKVEESILKAIDKRSISIWKVNSIISTLEYKWTWQNSITTKELWYDILTKLKEVDEVAYIRYASVYMLFEKSEDFKNFINNNIN